MALDKLTQITSSGINSTTPLTGITMGDFTGGAATFDSVGVIGIATAVTVQVGSATTVHTTGIDLGSGNITSHNINSTGIITATSFTATSGTFTGNVTIGGTLTYDDVTNIDSVGVITARNGIHIPGAGNLVGIGTTNPESRLHVYGTHNSHIRMTNTSDDGLDLVGDSNRSGQDQVILNIKSRWNGTDVAKISFKTGSDTTDKDDADIAFHTKDSGSSIAERLRITSDGKVGINDDNPERTLDVVGNNAMIQIEGSGGNGRQYSLCSTDGTTGPAVGSASQFVIYDDTSGTARLNITSDGKIGIGSTAPTQALDVVGRITKTEYEPGEIIERLCAVCDGSTHVVKSGSYTMSNVTAEQTGSTADKVCSGSTINYKCPKGAKRIHYEYWFKWEATERSGISHFFIEVDDADVVPSRRTFSNNYSRYGTNYYHYGEGWHCMSWVFECDASSTDTSEGQYADWADNEETKEIRTKFREYSGSYEISLHGNHYWDGAQASSTNQKPIKPMLIITTTA